MDCLKHGSTPRVKNTKASEGKVATQPICEACGKPVREGLRACEGLSPCWHEVARRDEDRKLQLPGHEIERLQKDLIDRDAGIERLTIALDDAKLEMQELRCQLDVARGCRVEAEKERDDWRAKVLVRPKITAMAERIQQLKTEADDLRKRLSTQGKSIAPVREETDGQGSVLSQTRRIIPQALDLAQQHGVLENVRYKAWVIDQMVQLLCGSPENYERWVLEAKAGTEGPSTYEWDKGLKP